MAITIKALVPGSVLGVAEATLYTAPQNTVAKISEVTLGNSSGTARVATIQFLRAGVAVFVTQRSVGANSAIEIPEARHVLQPGDSIQAMADAGAAVILIVSGAEIA